MPLSRHGKFRHLLYPFDDSSNQACGPTSTRQANCCAVRDVVANTIESLVGTAFPGESKYVHGSCQLTQLVCCIQYRDLLNVQPEVRINQRGLRASPSRFIQRVNRYAKIRQFPRVSIALC